MKIKIINDSTDNTNYGHLIGKVFDVHCVLEEKKLYQIGNFSWMYFVNFSDVEVLNDEIRKDFDKKRCNALDKYVELECGYISNCNDCRYYK